jgi:hypothetical protein
MQFKTVISTVSGSMENVAAKGVGLKTVDASQAQDPVRKDLLTKLVQEGILQPDYEKELHQLNDAGKSSKPFEALCQDYIDLVLDLYSEDIDVTDGNIQLEALTKEFGDLLETILIVSFHLG